MYYKHAPIPPTWRSVFNKGIDHPELWLWDSWTLQEPTGHYHLYCLALSRVRADGTAITPPERNDFTFHVRHFESWDFGHTWYDRGAVMQPGQVSDGADSRNVWSGSVLRVNADLIAFGFTGVRDCGAGRSFLQSICVATGPSPRKVRAFAPAPLSCPVRDYDDIRSKGYYLGPRESLGCNQGEEGGPIMAWRDPFFFRGPEGQLHAIWSAKRSATIPVIAHARVKLRDNQLILDALDAPIELPDALLMTQAEVPKIYRDPATGTFLLLVSACDRRYEGQPETEISHTQRLYCSDHIRGPWRSYTPGSSELPGLEGLFGASLLGHDMSTGRLKVIGPYTESAGRARQLRFAATLDLQLNIPGAASAGAVT